LSIKRSSFTCSGFSPFATCTGTVVCPSFARRQQAGVPDDNHSLFIDYDALTPAEVLDGSSDLVDAALGITLGLCS